MKVLSKKDVIYKYEESFFINIKSYFHYFELEDQCHLRIKANVNLLAYPCLGLTNSEVIAHISRNQAYFNNLTLKAKFFKGHGQIQY